MWMQTRPFLTHRDIAHAKPKPVSKQINTEMKFQP